MGKQKCKSCGEPIGPRWPVKNPNGSWNVPNLFKMDWQSILLVFVIVFMVWSYNHDIEQCKVILETPNTFCGEWCTAQGEYGIFSIERGPTTPLTSIIDLGVNETGTE